MDEQKPCEQCDRKSGCQELFSRLGNAQGPSVVRSILVAFVLPLAVFIGGLAAAQHFLAGPVESGKLRTLLAFLLALAVTFIFILIVRPPARRGLSGPAKTERPQKL